MLLTNRAFAAEMGVDPSTITRWISLGWLKDSRHEFAGRLMVDLEEGRAEIKRNAKIRKGKRPEGKKWKVPGMTKAGAPLTKADAKALIERYDLGGTDMQAAQLLHEQLKVALKKVELEELQKVLIRTDDIVMILPQIFRESRLMVENIPARISPLCAGRAQTEIEAVMVAEIKGILTELGTRLHDWAQKDLGRNISGMDS